MNQTISTILERVSNRQYLDTPLTKEQLDTLMGAAMASPSAVNRQPWHFSVVTNKALLDEINAEMRAIALAGPKEERSPRFEQEDFHVFYHAPCVIFLSGEEGWHWSALDSGIAVQTIALAAKSIGLGSVIVGMVRPVFEGENKEKFNEKLDIPEGYAYTIAIAIGNAKDSKASHPQKENKVAYIV